MKYFTILFLISIVGCSTHKEDKILTKSSKIESWVKQMSFAGFSFTSDETLAPEGHTRRLWRYNGGFIRLVFENSSKSITSLTYELFGNRPKALRYTKVFTLKSLDLKRNLICLEGRQVNLNLNKIFMPRLSVENVSLDELMFIVTNFISARRNIDINYNIILNETTKEKKVTMSKQKISLASLLEEISLLYDVKYKLGYEAIVFYK